ncbi:tripartite tricarboxylate transporter substrate binding protein [Achromobacter sp. GG226]|uniref:Bug family tripartite tricarboxylate transporter substrate binding protein n=1 Tax=Verticiella alkaliphila TaxID=2779529 RepID=UPI001C0E4A26|nr:tripartite tricarboxylate transporter substrate binding protein [Verticiella sp. GG226]MBU4610764.1 tripartite tricarboxylate transporter substrate binding protein [Verticiella sp. GG226]
MPALFRRRALGALLSLAALTLAATPAMAQSDRPIEWVVGYAAGGGSDVLARTIAEQLSKGLNRPILVTNKPGAATNIAAEYVARSKDYGNVIFTADFATLAANPGLFAKLPYDVEKDFKPVGMLARFPLLLTVSPQVPAKDFREFTEWAKKQGTVSYGSAGLGSPHHLAGELLRERSGLNLVHVPYRGGAPAAVDLLGGQIPSAILDTATVLQYIEGGKLRAVGVASPQRIARAPDVPTLAEQGLDGFEAYAWQGVVVPAGTPDAFVNDVAKALQAALASGPVKERMAALGLEALPGTPQDMDTYVRAERTKWMGLIKANNIRLE